MKKIFKSRIFIFILGVILSAGITSVLAYSLLAPDVGFTPKDSTWNVDNTKDALDDLYEQTRRSFKVYETGSFSVYIAKGSYASPRITLKNTYTSNDHARLIIYDVSPGGSPIYPHWRYSGNDIIGNTCSYAIVNYAGDASYSRTYTFYYAIIEYRNVE